MYFSGLDIVTPLKNNKNALITYAYHLNNFFILNQLIKVIKKPLIMICMPFA
jgi:hypothetical protein